MKTLSFLSLSCILLFLFYPGSLSAWQVSISPDKNTPEKLIAVDKNAQKLIMLENRSPLKKLFVLPCSTGEAKGDKKREGDMKTPEGIYFIETTIRGGLDYEMYGNIAYTLNYPNPVDRVLRKTGSGIWIHGKGSEIEPFDSRGCIVMNMNNINRLSGEVFMRLMPVVIAGNITWQEKNKNGESLAKLVELTNLWAESWSGKSDLYFQLYDPESFSISEGKSFRYFRDRKKRLFNQYPWIDLFVHNARAIEGPGYWVSYFGQLYRTPTFTSAGVKRLYWKEDKGGEFKIVGEEWRPYPAGNLQSEYIQDRTAVLKNWIYDWLNTWRTADLTKYIQFYENDAVQGTLAGRQNIELQKTRIWNEGLKPKNIEIRNLNIELHPQGFKITFEQDYSNMQGYSDRGIKEILCIPYGSQWLIVDETWTSL